MELVHKKRLSPPGQDLTYRRGDGSRQLLAHAWLELTTLRIIKSINTQCIELYNLKVTLFNVAAKQTK